MNKKENLNKLKMGLSKHKPIRVYMLGDYYDTFDFNGKIYQGKFGCMTIESCYKVAEGLIDGITIELMENEAND